nr:PAS domain S-box protein [uncultured Desulfobacter sp.]
MNKKRPNSIALTLALSFFAITTTALIIAGTFQIYIHAKTSAKTIAANQKLIARGAARSVGNFIEEKFSIMETALAMGQRSDSAKEIQGILESMLGRDKSFRNLVWLDAQGKIGATVSRQSQKIAQKFLQQMDGQTIARIKRAPCYISPVSIDAVTYEPLIILGLWWTDILGQYRGNLAVEVNLKFVWALVDGLKIGETGHSYVVDEKGNLLAAKDISRAIRGENLAHISKVAEFMDQENGRDIEVTTFTGMAGTRVVGTAVGLERPHWAVVSELPVKEAYQDVQKSILISAASLIFITLISVAAGILVARRLSHPLIRLSKIASRIARGEQGLKAPEEGPREIALLSLSFNHMTGQLGQMLKRDERRIKALKREIEQRRQTEEKFRLYMENAHDGVLIIGSDDRFEYANEQLGRILGYPLAEVMGQPFLRFLDEESRHLVSERNRLRHQDFEPPYRLELGVMRKDGEKRAVEISAGTTRDASGDVKIIGTLLDITDRKKTEQEIQKAYKIINRSPYIAFIWKNVQGWPVEYASQNVAVLFGYSAKEFIIGKVKFSEVIHPADMERVAEEVRYNSLKGTTRFVHEPYRIRTRSGEEKWVHDLTHIVRDARGEITHYEGIVYDITEHRLAEEELNRLRNYLANIVDSMPSVLVGVDNACRVTLWNKTVENAVGIPPEKAMGRGLSELMPWMAPEISKVVESLKTRQVQAERKRPRSLNGTTCYEDVTIYPLVTNGVEGAVIRVDDVTEKVRLEEMMVQSEKMFSVGGLAAGMAHEINNPLAGMLQNAMVMGNRLGRQLNIRASREAAEKAGTSLEAIDRYMDARGIKRMLTAIHESGERIAAIVNNMLSFARKSDAMVLSHQLNTLLDKALELAATDYNLKKQFDFKQIKLVRAYQEDLPSIPCEGPKIQQVLLNILRNGAQAMQMAGIKHPTFILRTNLEKERQMAVMEIEDNGPGMDEKTRKCIFEPFFTTKPEGLGTGLGLSVSYFIITENHGGEMAVASKPGEGACFTIRLPLQPSPDLVKKR